MIEPAMEIAHMIELAMEIAPPAIEIAHMIEPAIEIAQMIEPATEIAYVRSCPEGTYGTCRTAHRELTELSELALSNLACTCGT